MKRIDLRSDTVTRPSPQMLEAMMKAEVGDDVFGEDPTVNALQKKVAGLLGKEAALFVPSGTMGNEISIKAHTIPGDEIIVDKESHIFVYETAGPSVLSGVQMYPIEGVRGVFTNEQIHRAIRPNAYYMPATRLLCVENTHGRSGGSVIPIADLRRMRDFTLGEKIRLHLDGARIWNASAASGISPKEYASCADSISVCFSKALGAPVGSMVAGEAEFIERARKYRKIFGGGMRQAGILAAGALYALEHNFERLGEDHAKARLLGEELSRIKALRVDMSEVQTNFVIAETEGSGKSQSEILSMLTGKGVLMTGERYSAIRAVTHLDVSMDEVRTAARIIRSLFKE
jgi:threonine aldolase